MAKKNDSLGDRMKGYEKVFRHYLPRRIPVIIRLDGKAFHTFTKGMRKPFDAVLTDAMQQTMKYLCENIQGCVLGYTQSDEITLVLTDYATVKTDAWFGYNVQKMTSVASSMATLAFNRSFRKAAREFCVENAIVNHEGGTATLMLNTPENQRLCEVYDIARNRGGVFDARVFSIPKEEVCNCLIWRQQDATRNSIESVGQAYFSQRELHGKSCNEIQEMLWSEHDVNWNDFPTKWKRGSCCARHEVVKWTGDIWGSGSINTTTRRKWTLDDEIPIFTQNRDYVESLL